MGAQSINPWPAGNLDEAKPADQGNQTDFWVKHRADVWWVGAIVLLAVILMGLMLNPFLTVVNHDAAIFCILARSILDGHYLLVSEPNPQPYFTFPPLLSLQLAGLMQLFGNRDIQAMQLVFKGYISLLFLASLPLFYAWGRQMLPRRMDAVVLTALLAINPIVYKYTADILSDTPYWAFSMGAIYAAWRFRQTADTRHGRPLAWFALATGLIILCALTRQIGLALVLAFLVSLGLQRQWKLLVTAALLFGLTVGGWQSYEHFYRSSHRSDIDSLNQQGVQQVLDKSPIKLEYVKHFLVDRPVNKDQSRLQTSPQVLLNNAVLRLHSYTKYSLDQLLPKLRVRIGAEKDNLAHFMGFRVIFWGLLLLGLSLCWRVFPFAALYLGIYMAVLLVYPYISVRFLLPVFPIILLCTYWGLVSGRDWLAGRWPGFQKRAWLVVPAFMILALIGQLPETIRRVHDGFELKVANVGPSLRTKNRAYHETLLWIKAHTPENSLIVSRKPPVTYFYSERVSTAFPFTRDTDEIFNYVLEKRERYGREFPHIYIFEDMAFGESERYLKPMVEQYHDRLSLVYTEPATHSRVWRLK